MISTIIITFVQEIYNDLSKVTKYSTGESRRLFILCSVLQATLQNFHFVYS